MRGITAYVVFAVVYGGLLFLTTFVTDKLGSSVTGVATGWAAPFVVAPLALLATTRSGSLSTFGVAIASFVLGACVCIATISILCAIAIPAVDDPPFEYAVGTVVSYFTLGGWRLLLSLALLVVAPSLWSVLLGRRPPAVRAAN